MTIEKLSRTLSTRSCPHKKLILFLDCQEISNFTQRLNNVDMKNDKEFSHPESCSVCLEKYNEKELHRILPCGHAFHAGCIDNWLLNSNNTCPICKNVIKLPINDILLENNINENEQNL